MTLQKLLEKYLGKGLISLISKQVKSGKNIHIKGLYGSVKSLVVAAQISRDKTSKLIIMPDKESAGYFQNDLKALLPDEEIWYYPASYRRSALQNRKKKEDGISSILRAEVIKAVSTNPQNIIVSYPEALAEKVIDRKELKSNTLEVNKGEELSVDFIIEVMNEYGFKRTDFVAEPGEYAVRGSIVDIFSYADDYPYRLDFFDDEIESIRAFDTVSQLSVKHYEQVVILPDIRNNVEDEKKIPFFELLPEDSTFWLFDSELIFARFEEEIEPGEGFLRTEQFTYLLSKSKFIEFSPRISQKLNDNISGIEYKTQEQKAFHKNFELLAENFNQAQANGFTNYIMSSDDKQIERLKSVLSSEELKQNADFVPVKGVLHRGFTDFELKINCYTDHQIFGRYYKYRLKSVSYHKNKEAITISEINKLSPGDYVVHSDHGIGQFGGLVSTETKSGKMQEAVRLLYRDNDILLVNIHNLHKISKYKGKEGTAPKIYKLGSAAWSNLKKRTKKRVKDIARELIALYAKRKEEEGFAFASDSYMQHALESSFIYEDTPDQSKATEAVKEDMEKNIPMDRLVCGDVGFGKTEIAVRAAFKAAVNGKQTAVLVPTTVLSFQHYKTFSERLKDFPVKVDYISRMKTGKRAKESLKKLSEGETDIIIGTHRIVSKDIKFKNLGLLIVDEEQKFGVSVKEKLKNLKINVDTLTLTATPIPRTLQFSLMGARDLSLIHTPPPNRYPIVTELHRFDKEVIRQAVKFETERSGQIFFIHNRIKDIHKIEALLRDLLPDLRIAVAHGRMKGADMEQVLMDFIDEQYDLLLATTIVGSGVDIPNANTIIINNAQNFGLSDLHQLRGRVGRSDKKAYCYLLSPPFSTLSEDARRRLNAVESFSELGSGFNIAMQDLDIRGAGNLLGGEQSGFITDIGYETYHRILDEAMLELRDEEFKQLFKEAGEKEKQQLSKKRKYVTDCHLDTDFELRLPKSYVENTTERLKLYRDLDKIENAEELPEFEAKLRDRFGELPRQAKDMLQAVRLRQKAMSLGFEKLLLKNKIMIAWFVSDKKSSFYDGPVFLAVLNVIKRFPHRFEMKEKYEKLMLKIPNVKSVTDAQAVLNLIQDELEKIQ